MHLVPPDKKGLFLRQLRGLGFLFTRLCDKFHKVVFDSAMKISISLVSAVDIGVRFYAYGSWIDEKNYPNTTRPAGSHIRLAAAANFQCQNATPRRSTGRRLYRSETDHARQNWRFGSEGSTFVRGQK